MGSYCWANVFSGTRYEGKEEEENMILRMSDVWEDHDDELILLVNHHDEQPIRRQHDKAANDG